VIFGSTMWATPDGLKRTIEEADGTRWLLVNGEPANGAACVKYTRRAGFPTDMHCKNGDCIRDASDPLHTRVIRNTTRWHGTYRRTLG
jgi:hypothetical protein